MKHLEKQKVQAGRFQSTMLCQVAQAAFPKESSLVVPQYKKRTIQTLLRHMEGLEKLPSHPQAVLLSSSMFERLSWQQILRPSSEHLFNFSVGGDGVEHLLFRLAIAHQTYLAQTKDFVVLIGINNVMGASRGNESQSAEASAVDIVAGIVKVVRFLHQNSRAPSPPNIHLCKLLPIWGSEELNYRRINPVVDQVNDMLEATQFPPNVRLLNTSMPLDPRNYEPDGLHLSRIGYKHLLSQLPDFVQKQQQPKAQKKHRQRTRGA